MQKTQKDYGGLVGQLQIQREAAARSLNKLQHKSKEQLTELQAKVETLNVELQEVGTLHICTHNIDISSNKIPSHDLRVFSDTFHQPLLIQLFSKL